MSTFIVAEVGSNWRTGQGAAADLDMAQRLISAAAQAGADAVKFQFFRPGGLYVLGAGRADYLKGAGSINDLVRENALPADYLPVLASLCAKAGIEFGCTAYEPEDVAVVDPHVRWHKIASYELQHEALVRAAAATGKPLVISTGAQTQEEVDAALGWALDAGALHVTLLHCVAAYPAPAGEYNLAVLRRWRAGYIAEHGGRVSVGLSDHTQEPVIVPVAAVALGATWIEKHFTLDRTLPGPDHAFALAPAEFRLMVNAIRLVESALGDGRKVVRPCEQELWQFATRSVQAARDIAVGAALISAGPERNIVALRPGARKRGADARYLTDMAGMLARVAIKSGAGVGAGDVVPSPGRS